MKALGEGDNGGRASLNLRENPRRRIETIQGLAPKSSHILQKCLKRAPTGPSTGGIETASTEPSLHSAGGPPEKTVQTWLGGPRCARGRRAASSASTSSSSPNGGWLKGPTRGALSIRGLGAAPAPAAATASARGSGLTRAGKLLSLLGLLGQVADQQLRGLGLPQEALGGGPL